MSDPLLKWREEFPIVNSKAGYLINNSLGAMPRQVSARLAEFADVWAREGVLAWRRWLPMVRETADLVGSIINAPAGTMMMHQNVSTLTSVLISALNFRGRRNKIVLTDLNFPSVVYNWMAQRANGARVEVVATADGISIDAQRVIEAIDDTTLVVAIDLVLFRSSSLVDVAPIIEAAHRKGAIVVLDAYQAVGAVPIDVQHLNVDVLTGGSVKWLCGGPGAAFVYVRPDLLSQLRPLQTGWFSDKRPFDFRFGEVDYADDAHRLMGGSPSVPALYSAQSGYEIIRKVGVDTIRAKSLRQTQGLIDAADRQGLSVNTPRAASARGNTVCVDFAYSEDCSRRLIERGFVIDWRPNGGIRISPHFYNSDEECQNIMSAIAELRSSGELRPIDASTRSH